MKRWVRVALILILALGLDNRLALLRATGGHLHLMHDTGIYVNMSEHLADGVGVYQPGLPGDPYHYETHARLVGYFHNDVGLSLIYWLARHLFPGSADPSMKLVWLQIAADLFDVWLIFWLGRRLLGSDLAGLLAAGLYAGFDPICQLCIWPYYHFWAGAFALWNLAVLAVLLDGRRADQPVAARTAWGALGGAFLGLATLVRSTFLPVGFLDGMLLLARWRRRWRRMLPMLGVLVLLPGSVVAMLMLRAHARFGTWSAPRPVWHQIYVGIGSYPNPFGITWDDASGFSAGSVNGGDYWDVDKLARYEANLHARVLDIVRVDPWLLPRNALRRASDALSLAFSEPGWLLHGVRVVDGRGREAYVLALMAVQLVCFWLLFRTPDNGWLYGAIFLQTAFFVGSLSWITPPLFQYNVAYYPAFILGCAVGAGAAARALRWSLGMGERRPEYAGASRRLMFLAGTWAGVLCWLVPWIGSPDDSSKRLAYALAAPAAVATLLPVVASWLDLRRARAVGVGVATAAVLAALLYGHVPRAMMLGWDPLTAIPQVAAGAVGVWTLLAGEPLVVAVAMLTLGTRFHPEYALLPLALMALLRPAWAARTEVLARAARAAAWAAPCGLAALSAARLAGWPYLDAVAVWGPLLFLAGCAAARRMGGPAALRLAVAGGLLLFRFHDDAAWQVLGMALGVAWLSGFGPWDVDPYRVEANL